MSETSHFQTFRVNSSQLVHIPVYLDSKTGDNIVLWHDIQQYFQGAQYILSGDRAITFLKDERFLTIIPERIRYQPDVVLDVVLEKNATVAGAQPVPISKSTALVPTSPTDVENAACASLTISPPTEDENVTSSAHDSVGLQILSKSNDRGLVNGANGSRDYMQDVLYHVEALKSGQEALRTGQEALRTGQDKRFGELSAAMDENKALQVAILEMQQRMHEMQKQTLDRLATLHSRIQAVFTQTYELHEYPIPRLFIVLPRLTKSRGKLGTPLAKQFRLYFLCECGEHTTLDASKISNEVHLAKHEGYDLNKPTEFFEKYGNYALAMMQMVKFGFTAAGMVVPALSDLKVAEGAEAIQKSLDYGSRTMDALVDETIIFLEGVLNGIGAGTSSPENRASLDQQEVLEGADLRQLESYLNVMDKGRTLGNLNRTVTSEGHVKWVCIDHRRAMHGPSTDHRLEEIVEINGGSYNPAEGLIQIKLLTKTLARQFYDVLTKARGIQELDVCLAWDATMKDLQELAMAVTTASVAMLTIDGSYFKGPARDFLNNGRRFDPVVQLLSNGHIQSLDLQNFSAFYERIGMSSTAMATQIRALRINTEIHFGSTPKKGGKTFLTSVLNSQQALDKLTLHCVDISKAFDFIVSALPGYQTINSLRLSSPSAGCTLVLDISEGTIRTMVATLRNGIQDPSLSSLLLSGHLTKLVIKRRTPSLQDRDTLVRIFKTNSSLKEILCLCSGFKYQEIVTAFILIRETAMQQAGSCPLRVLQLKRHKSGDSRDSKGELVEMTCNYVESKDGFDAHSTVHMGDLKYSPCDATTYHSHLRHYGWTVQVLTTNSAFSDDHAQQFLHSLDGRKSKLTRLSLVTGSLSTEGLHSMSMIISASPLLTTSTCILTIFTSTNDRTLRQLFFCGTEL
ncbi:hypothetical protein BGZ70_007252 [Mortierella alpina]|uniref:Uncharacterized protein n=1 Tax=Mortierella alpina TaxID=64518 RepID=A0A9P6J6S4_MORAP|nr:hypothetical protein BGZ70_007252 [Mortierella alpina]